MHFIKPVDAPLYVVTPIVNPSRYQSRYRLYHGFAKYIADAGAILYTVEAAYGTVRLKSPMTETPATSDAHPRRAAA